MKLFKSLLVVVVLSLVGVIVFQNSAVFTHKESLSLNLWVWSDQTPPIQLSIYFLGFFLLGLLLAYLHGLSDRFKARNVAKNYVEKISKLEEEIRALKSLPLQEEEPPSQETEPA
jgi:ABC-type Na+ efflux pump permease subunit